jgi:hypothetical protein
MIDPRLECILIRDRDNGMWKDKTYEVDRYQALGARIVLQFNTGRKYTYNHDRVRILRHPRPVSISSGSRIVVSGEVWRKGAARLTKTARETLSVPQVGMPA